MARSHARILCTIWQDADFVRLSPGAQWLYVLVLSQPDLSHCGVVPYRPTRWAALAAGMTRENVEKRVAELERAGFIETDETTEELWVRSFVKYDGIETSPNMVKAMRAAVRQVFSPTIRAGVQRVSDAIPDPPPKGSAKGSGNPLANPSVKGSDKRARDESAGKGSPKGSAKGSAKGSPQTAGKGVGERGSGLPPVTVPTETSLSIAPPTKSADATNNDEVADAEIVEPGTLITVASIAEPTRVRALDVVWDALMVACDVDAASVTASARGAYNRAAKSLRDVSATPDDIARRALIFQAHWPGVNITPTALARRWAECGRLQSRNGEAIRTAAIVQAVYDRDTEQETL